MLDVCLKKYASFAVGQKRTKKHIFELKDGETFRDRVRASMDPAQPSIANVRRVAIRLLVRRLRLLVHFHQLLPFVSLSILVVRASLSLLVRHRSTQSAQRRPTPSSRHRKIHRLGSLLFSKMYQKLKL